jgi:hypothetical protein
VFKLLRSFQVFWVGCGGNWLDSIAPKWTDLFVYINERSTGVCWTHQGVLPWRYEQGMHSSIFINIFAEALVFFNLNPFLLRSRRQDVRTLFYLCFWVAKYHPNFKFFTQLGTFSASIYFYRFQVAHSVFLEQDFIYLLSY